RDERREPLLIVGPEAVLPRAIDERRYLAHARKVAQNTRRGGAAQPTTARARAGEGRHRARVLGRWDRAEVPAEPRQVRRWWPLGRRDVATRVLGETPAAATTILRWCDRIGACALRTRE